jgi:hypothetical protein
MTIPVGWRRQRRFQNNAPSEKQKGEPPFAWALARCKHSEQSLRTRDPGF